MKLFLDTANLIDIEEALRGGFIRGITTNPSLLAKEPKANYVEHIKKITTLAKKYGRDISVSIEVFSNDEKEMIKQATQFVKQIKYKHLVVKVPISYKGQSNLAVMKELSDRGITVNCTACVTPLQLMMAAASGAKYVSLFYNRLRDAEKEDLYKTERDALIAGKAVRANDYDPDKVLRETVELLKHYPKAEIIVGSIRTPLDVKDAGLNGGHIITASLKILKASLMHFKTDDSVDGFLKDFAAWMK
jgi:transaldolase